MIALYHVAGENVRAGWHDDYCNILEADQRMHRLIHTRASSKGTLIDKNRNQAVWQFLSNPAFHGCSHLLFWDTDIRANISQLYGMYYNAVVHDLDISAALYFNFMDDFMYPMWYRAGGKRSYHTIKEEIRGELLEIDAAATGFMMIHRRVLEALWNEHNLSSWFGHDLIRGADGQWENLGEDLAFCRRAQAKGFKVWGDPTIGEVGHDKVVTLNIKWYLAQQKVLDENHS